MRSSVLQIGCFPSQLLHSRLEWLLLRWDTERPYWEIVLEKPSIMPHGHANYLPWVQMTWNESSTNDNMWEKSLESLSCNCRSAVFLQPCVSRSVGNKLITVFVFMPPSPLHFSFSVCPFGWSAPVVNLSLCNLNVSGLVSLHKHCLINMDHLLQRALFKAPATGEDRVVWM